MGYTKIKVFIYKCKCGFVRNVFVDFGMPEEYTKCRICESAILRQDI